MSLAESADAAMSRGGQRSLSEQLERLDDAIDARARGRARRREEHALGSDAGREARAGRGRRGGRGGGGGRKRLSPFDGDLPASERQVDRADTEQADRATRATSVAAHALQSAVLELPRDPDRIRAALAHAQLAGVQGDVISESEVALIELQIEAATPSAPPLNAIAPSTARPLADDRRCTRCGIMFFSRAALDAHVCFAALAEAGGEESSEAAVGSQPAPAPALGAAAGAAPVAANHGALGLLSSQYDDSDDSDA